MKRNKNSNILRSRQFRANSCDGKVAYASPQKAYASAQEAGHIQWTNYTHYHCYHCGQWHIAHARDRE